MPASRSPPSPRSCRCWPAIRCSTSLGRSFDPPLLGPVYVSTTLVFDIGVYLVVVGLVFMVFEAFGDDEADEAVPQ